MLYCEKGYIGNFEMEDKESGKKQLKKYVKQMKKAGHNKIIAPVDGSTWHSYRLASWSSGESAFPMEPQNPLWYNEVYKETGFKPLQKYRSDKFALGNVTKIAETDNSLHFRGLCENDLQTIYEISLQGFVENFLYSNITYEEFSKLYQPVLPMLDSELAVIAELDNSPVGFMFSFAAGERQILKTMAILPGFRKKGIGAKMMNTVLLAGQKKGLKAAIAALISEGNHSHSIVSKYGSEKIREYTLYYLED